MSDRDNRELVDRCSEQHMKRLSFIEREIIKFRYMPGENGVTYTQPEVARIFKVRLSRVQYREKKGLEKLRKMIREEDGHAATIMDEERGF